jgi:MoxR-like ATPase
MVSDWHIFKGNPKQPHSFDAPPPPPWRDFSKLETHAEKGSKLIGLEDRELDVINAAIYLRRPLLVEGKAGIGKTTLAYAIAAELGLGDVLRWSITTHSSLKEGLYHYDAIGRLQETNLHRADKPLPIEDYLRLGVLGTAFASSKPRVLLIDEIDKSDIDLPNDLLHLFEEGEFEIPELSRLSEVSYSIFGCDKEKKVAYSIDKGRVRCQHFPIVIMTSNRERDFSPAFLRRCMRLELSPPDENKLARIVEMHFGEDKFASKKAEVDSLIQDFFTRRNDKEDLATDQLLNAVHLVLQAEKPEEELLKTLWKPLNAGEQT